MKAKQIIKNKIFHSIKSGWRWLWCRLYDPRWYRIGQATLAIAIMGVCLSAFADGTDILQGTDASLWATLNGTGKKYIYAAGNHSPQLGSASLIAVKFLGDLNQSNTYLI